MKPFRIKVLINLLTHLLYYTPRKHQKPWDSRILEDFKIKVNIDTIYVELELFMMSITRPFLILKVLVRNISIFPWCVENSFFKKFIVGHPHGKMIYQKATWKLIIWLTPTEKIVDAFFKKTFEKKKRITAWEFNAIKDYDATILIQNISAK